MRIGRTAAIGAALVAIAGGLGTAASADGASGVRGRGIDPANFTTPMQNPYFPLVPGTVFVYRGTEDGDKLRERLTITERTKVIQGVTTTVVQDVLHANGALREKTTDWYAPDNDGNVWYFGEATAVYAPDGHVTSTEGSWEAGVEGGIAGTIMPAGPRPTDAYRQEFYRGHAEDQAWVVQTGLKTKVPYGWVDQVARTFEWTRLEPNVTSAKYYASGLGIVRELDVAGGSEFLELVDVTTRPRA